MLANIAGAMQGADVSIIYEKNGVTIEWDQGENTCTRFVTFQNDKVVMENFVLDLKEHGTGLGTQIFARQVDFASQHGIDKIVATAAGRKGSGINGYYTWARLGYDAALDGQRSAAEAMAIKEFGASRISDLMKTPEGRSFWKENGGSFKGEFDLSEGSTARRVLSEYVAAKKGNN